METSAGTINGLRALRAFRELSLDDVAAGSGVDRSDLSRLERSVLHCSDERLERLVESLATYFRVSADQVRELLDLPYKGAYAKLLGEGAAA